MTERFLITAATGQVGPYAARALVDRGHAVRALVIEGDERASVLPDEVEIVTGSLDDPVAVEAALDDVSHVFWMWPFFYLPTTAAPAMVERMSEHALRVAVVSSVGVHIGVERSDNNCHAYLEELLVASRCRWTSLRTTGFMGNARGWAPQIRGSGVVRFPYGEARRTSVHERDLAEAGVHALLDNGHVGQAYLVSGSETLSQR
ncbi:SDR family oxidoreductase, partial [Micrococcus sp.]|uniref:SDR family oxidoreductase n=1 Tax=Micrococcus sp. TaxID=1271 RepID=UPI0026DB4CFD